MKKVLILIVIFLLTFSINVFAYEIPQTVLDYFDTMSANYKFITHNSIQNITFITFSDNPISVSENTSSSEDYMVFNSSSNISQVRFDNGVYKRINDFNTSKIEYWYNIYKSNYDVFYADSTDVFFSEPFLASQGVPSIVPTVIQSSKAILVPSVVILALLLVVSLIPRVLYRL